MKKLTPRQLKKILADLRLAFEHLYGNRLVEMILYGSQARGDAEPGSDIDVLVILSGTVKGSEEIDRTLDIISDLSLEYNILISCLFMDEEQFKTHGGPFLMNVRREGMPV